MKLRHLCTYPHKWRNHSTSTTITRFINVWLYPSRTLTTSSTPSSDTLYRRLIPARRNPNVSIASILEEWVNEGIDVNRISLLAVINQLKRSRDYRLALQICEWMNGQKCLGSSVAYGQVQIDLITKVHGLEQAEKYFDNLPNSLRPWQGYIVLLNCYAKEKMLAKAEAVMQKFRELRYAKPLPYNIMLGLYSQLRKHSKLDYLVQEMEEKDIRDKVTYNIRLNIYVASSDIEQMERLLMKMEVDPMVTMDWKSYSIAANGYLNASATEKACAALRKAEHLIKVDTSSSPYDFLLTLYARAGRKDDVHRMWNLQKETRKFSNRSYLSMMSALTILDDLDGAEKILDEWEAGHTYFEHRIPNFLISIYCNKGNVRKAGSILNRLIKSGKKPDSCAWSHMGLGYLQVSQMDKVVETTKEALLASHTGWRSNFPTLVAACLKYLEGKGDVDKAEEIVRLIQKKSVLSMHSTKKLVKYWGNKELAQRLHVLWEGQQT